MVPFLRFSIEFIIAELDFIIGFIDFFSSYLTCLKDLPDAPWPFQTGWQATEGLRGNSPRLETVPYEPPPC